MSKQTAILAFLCGALLSGACTFYKMHELATRDAIAYQTKIDSQTAEYRTNLENVRAETTNCESRISDLRSNVTQAAFTFQGQASDQLLQCQARIAEIQGQCLIWRPRPR
jgi:hypothetical protein